MSDVQGIWNNDELTNEKFVRFFSLVQDEARKSNCLFFTWAGEGREIFTDDLEGEDLSGWLIPFDRVHEFEPLWQASRFELGDRFSDDICFAEWFLMPDGSVGIDFVKY